MTDADNGMNLLHFGNDPANPRIRINPEIWIRIPDNFCLKLRRNWRCLRYAAVSPSASCIEHDRLLALPYVVLIRYCGWCMDEWDDAAEESCRYFPEIGRRRLRWNPAGRRCYYLPDLAAAVRETTLGRAQHCTNDILQSLCYSVVNASVYLLWRANRYIIF